MCEFSRGHDRGVRSPPGDMYIIRHPYLLSQQVLCSTVINTEIRLVSGPVRISKAQRGRGLASDLLAAKANACRH